MKRQTISTASMAPRALLDNLRDAGCDAETAAQFMALEETGALPEQLRLLSAHRRQLLDQLHQAERRIDCLDYLTYRLQTRADPHGDATNHSHGRNPR